jgi:hypothetical protein
MHFWAANAHQLVEQQPKKPQHVSDSTAKPNEDSMESSKQQASTSSVIICIPPWPYACRL